MISAAVSPGVGQRSTSWPGRWLWVLLPPGVAALLWGLSLRGVDPGQMNDLGLVSILPGAAFAALVILTTGFCLANHTRKTPESILLLYVLVLVLLLHGTPVFLYGTLRYSWAWKHVGIVDYIQRHGTVDPFITWLSAYHNWPGFFALNALLTEVSGLDSALAYAGWAPVFFNVLFVLGIQLIARTLTPDRRLVWLSVWIFEISNWIGQDYFSPQALAYSFYLVALGIILRWFMLPESAPKHFFEPWLRTAAATFLRVPAGARIQGGWLGPQERHVYPAMVGSTEAIPEPVTMARWQRVVLIVIVMLTCVSIAPTHQLTPVIAVIALSTLVLARRCSALSLPLLMAVCTVGWIVYMAVGFLNGNLYWIVDSIGLFTNNVRSTFIDLSNASPGQRLVAIVDRILSATVAGLAVLGCLRRLRLGYWDLECILLAGAAFPMLVANSYGGEIMFRVYLFALPFLAFFAAALFYPTLAAGRTWRTAAAATVFGTLLLGGLLVGYYGKERAYYFTQNEINATEFLYATAPTGSLWVSATTLWPTQYRQYERYEYALLESIVLKQPGTLTQDPVGVLSALMGNPRFPAAYLVITRSQKAAFDMTGTLPVGTLDQIEEILVASGRFRAVFRNADAVILEWSPT